MKIHILALGQSNLANHGLPKTRCGFGRALHDGGYFPLEDPVPGGSGEQGSIWPRLAGRLESREDIVDMIVSLRAVGGTSMADWSPGGMCYEHLAEEIEGIRSHTIAPTHVVFHQGERDNLLGTSAEAYMDGFTQLHAFVSGYLPEAVWIICQASCRSGITAPLITDAQRRLAATLPNCVPGPNTDDLGEAFRYDGTHLNEAGLDAFAHQLSSCLRGGRMLP